MSIMIRKGGTVCAVSSCSSRTIDKHVKFFRFPKDPERAKQWLVLCNRQDLLNKNPDTLCKNYRLCELHFESVMYTNPRGLRNSLLPTAIPTKTLNVNFPFKRETTTSMRDTIATLSISCSDVEERTWLKRKVTEEDNEKPPKRIHIFSEKSIIKEEFEDSSCCIDVFETCVRANDTELKDNTWYDRIKEYQIASTVDDMKIELPSSEACNIAMNDNVKMENEINTDDIKVDCDNKLFYSTEYKVVSTVDDIKIELPSSEACNIVVNDNVKIENGINPEDIKIEFDNKLFFCYHCNGHYEDYCTKCGMLTHILNGSNLSITDGRAIKGIPNNIVEIRKSSGHVRVFALKVIPEDVKIGPFNGLSTSEYPRRLRGGKFITSEDKSKLLNWMQYINPARNIFQQNLIPFQRDDNLYYRSNREILVGEELLVYFGEEYEDCVNKDFEMDFTAPTEDDVKDVFACTPCCLGFSSRGYLAKHKSSCPNEINGKFSFDELTQCPFCCIHFYEKEYLECHRPYCFEMTVSKCIPLALDNQTVKVNRRKTHRLQMYKCTQCKYKTSYKSVLRSHFNKHYEVKMYRCDICSRQFKTKGSLKLHVKYIHIDVEEKEDKKCSMRDYINANGKARCLRVYHYSQDEVKQHSKSKFQTKLEYNVKTHVKTEHLKQFSYECEICDYKTNYKQVLENHIKSKHLKQFNYECEKCNYKTNRKAYLEAHVKTKHLKQFKYECDICDYKAYRKFQLESHMKTKHLKQFSYECEICDYKINQKSRLEAHIKSIHLKQFSFECEMCDYKTNQKSNLETHVKSIHLKQFSYECEKCDYKTNQKSNLKNHVRSIHLKQFNYECKKCDYKTNQNSQLETHIKSIHLKEFSYECEKCDYKTNIKSHLETHIKSIHLKEFSFECERCNYKTNRKSNLQTHTKSIHLKEFSYECERCDYKTNRKPNLLTHIKSIHLRKFRYECKKCDYKTNIKSHLETHIKSIHLKEFSYECERCDYKTNRKPNLRTHIKSIHLKEFSYECEKCDYKTNIKSHFETHIKSIHLKEFSYECDRCDYKTKRKSNLQTHIKSIHLKEFSYNCERCDYKTNRKPNLQAHIKSIHQREFSYECEKCDYKTNIKSHLEAHIKTKHLKEFSYECEKCDYKTNIKTNLQIHIKSVHLKEFS